MCKDKDISERLDLTGFGAVAKAIPPEVYTQSANTIIETFNKLTAPITETTSGFGRYIKQKFDNMVDAEKALATYTVQNAIAKAEAKTTKSGTLIISTVHQKSFVKSIEEASKETDPTLHEMWENLLANQLTNTNSHPHFVEILPHFSPEEANILMSLFPVDEIGEHGGGYLSYSVESFKHWIRNTDDTQLKEWNYSCALLLEFKFADVMVPKKGQYKYDDGVTILFKTNAGNTFLSAVSQ